MDDVTALGGERYRILHVGEHWPHNIVAGPADLVDAGLCHYLTRVGDRGVAKVLAKPEDMPSQFFRPGGVVRVLDGRIL